ncbi:MAG: hypothetical protein ACOYKM_05160 [Caulobacterales bacterium]|jgi:hypothetical protein
MSQPKEAPNPERRSNAALMCLFIGLAMMGVAWLLGVGGVLTLALAGEGDLAAAAGGTAGLILLPLAAVLGFLFAVVGSVWLAIQVIADQTGAHHKDPYRDVER